MTRHYQESRDNDISNVYLGELLVQVQVVLGLGELLGQVQLVLGLGELLGQVQVVLGLRLGSGICKWTVVTSITSSGGSGARSTEHYRFL